ncbi:MAG: FtsW/RodA/SpoVE family cell cycle protein [Candidatus Kaiserbacteria bacterium]|nr:FtsW/RodA/SpoVE family cell cycle protein [Candidatus Kaiserbacteria bacterium]
MEDVLSSVRRADWLLIAPVFLIMVVGLITNIPVDAVAVNSLIVKQTVFVLIAMAIILAGTAVDYAILRGPLVPLLLYSASAAVLVSLLLFAPEINGAKSWFPIGPIAVQPVDFAKLVLILTLARFFVIRHTHLRHVIISLILTGTLFLLVFAQPDLGSSVILIAIWIGIIFVSGVSRRHIMWLAVAATFVALVGWQFIPEYQKDRVLAFIEPLENLESAGYTTNQAKIAIGSGMLFGKGIGEGTQANMGFLPLYESDFVFAAFAEEWGFFGVMLLLLSYGIIGWRLLVHARQGRTSFEALTIVGIFALIFSHMAVHVGVNTGTLPVTGITLPFMSYGGSHLIAEAIAIALVLSMARRQLPGTSAELSRRRIA